MQKEFIMIERSVFNEMLERLTKLDKLVNVLCERSNATNNNKWLSAKEVCSILRITPKTLANYRDGGKLGFSQIEGKFYYLKNDIQSFLDASEVSSHT